MSTDSISVIWSKEALTWLRNLPTAPKLSTSSSSSSPASSSSFQRIQNLCVPLGEQDSTSIVQAVFLSGDHSLGALYRDLQAYSAAKKNKTISSSSGKKKSHGVVSEDGASGKKKKSSSPSSKKSKKKGAAAAAASSSSTGKTKKSKKNAKKSSSSDDDDDDDDDDAAKSNSAPLPAQDRSVQQEAARRSSPAAKFVQLVMRCLVVKMLGQVVSWTTAVSLARVHGAALTIDVNEMEVDEDSNQPNAVAVLLGLKRKKSSRDKAVNEDDDDDDTSSSSSSDSSSSRSSSSSSSNTSSSDDDDDDSSDDSDEVVILSNKSSKNKAKNSSSTSKKLSGTRRGRISLGSDDDDDDDDDDDSEAAAAAAAAASKEVRMSFLPGVSERPEWSMSSFISEQQRKQRRAIDDPSSQQHQRSPYIPSAPWSFVDGMLEQKGPSSTTVTAPATKKSTRKKDNVTGFSNSATVLPFVVGNVARVLEKNAPGDKEQAWEWCAYVRGHLFQDLSPIVDKVVFHIHDTFPAPHAREVTSAPFELRLTGWGHFVVYIDIHFKCAPSASISSSWHKPVTRALPGVDIGCPCGAVRIGHMLRFNPYPVPPRGPYTSMVSEPRLHRVPPLGFEYTPDCELEIPTIDSTHKGPNVWETYDEIVLVRPPQFLFNNIERYNAATAELMDSLPTSATSKRYSVAVDGILGKGVPPAAQVSARDKIEKNGLPPMRVCDDTADYEALTELRDVLRAVVEKKILPKIQGAMLSGGAAGGQRTLTTTSAAVMKLTDARAWNHYRRLADSLLESIANQNDEAPI